MPLVVIDPAMVRQWYSGLDPAAPTRRAHAYALLRTILGSAVTDGLIVVNPCHIRGAGASKRVHKIKPASLGELEITITPRPPVDLATAQRYQDLGVVRLLVQPSSLDGEAVDELIGDLGRLLV